MKREAKHARLYPSTLTIYSISNFGGRYGWCFVVRQLRQLVLAQQLGLVLVDAHAAALFVEDIIDIIIMYIRTVKRVVTCPFGREVAVDTPIWSNVSNISVF